jgi:hypothetical protein
MSSNCQHSRAFTAPTLSGALLTKCLTCGESWFVPEHEQSQYASGDMKPETQQQPRQTPAAREQVQGTAVRQNVHNLALRIGIRAAAREYGLKESRALNWAWRDGWHIGKRKHRSHSPVNRCRLCGQPVINI